MSSPKAYKIINYHQNTVIIVAFSVDLYGFQLKDYSKIAWTQLIWLSERNMLDAVDLPGNP